MSPNATPTPVNGSPPTPPHRELATTMMPAHGMVATTAEPVGGDPVRAPAGARQSSYSPGETLELGRYRLTIKRLLYVGGQAELYVVTGGPAAETVLKLYNQGARPKPDVLDRWRALPRSAIIALLDADPHSEPRAWELLTFAEGGPLAGGSDAAPAPLRDPARLKSIIKQAAEALHTLHTAGGVVHRDVSPDNFLWLDAARTRLVLSDLGSSSVLSGGAAKSRTIRGKLPFMAPEEHLPMGEGVVVGPPADLYALGIIVLTLWSGQHPFVGREVDQIALKSRGAVPVPDDLPQDFRSLVEALLLPANIRLKYEGIQRWLSDQEIPRAAAVRTVSYQRLTVRPAQGAPYEVDTPAGLARFLRDEPAAGERFLYAWNMREWASADAGLVADLTDIVEKEFAKNRAAGRQKAAYLLDSTLPFAAPDGAVCSDYAELSAWLEGDPARPKGLVDPAHPLWLYLTTRPERELREAMAELDADVRQGKPEATAVIRHYLMQYAAAGSWTDSDGTVVADLDDFLSRLEARAGEHFSKLLDPADPLTLWLDTHLPGTAERVGRLRTLDRETIAILTASEWIACALNEAPTICGLALAEPEDAWREELWAGAAGDSARLGRFMHGWWQVVQDGRFEPAALAWLADRPQVGARRQVVIALLANQWQGTLKPLTAVLATCFAALPPWSGDPADAVVLQAAGEAAVKQLVAIRDTAPEGNRNLVAVEAVTAFTLAALAARASAPSWWDASLAWIGGQLSDTVRDAFAAYKASPNVLAEVIARRNEMQRALSGFRIPALARWSAEDARRKTLEQELASEEAKTRDARLRVINDKAIELRGTPHEKVLAGLKASQPALVQKLYRSGVALLVGVTGFGAALFWAASVDIQHLQQARQPWPVLVALITGQLLVGVAGWVATRSFFGRFAALIAAIGGVIAVDQAPFVLRLYGLPVNRAAIGVLLAAWLGVALFLRWRHARQVVDRATQEARMVPAELTASTRKACDDAEALARASLGERWLMLHAVLGLAADPAQVQLGRDPRWGNFPGGSGQAP